MPFIEPALSGVVATLLAALSVYTSFTLARRLLGSVPVSVRWCGTGVVCLWLLMAVFHVLAPFGWFTPILTLLVWLCLSLIARLGLDADGGSIPLVCDDLRQLAARLRQAGASREGWLYGFGAAILLFSVARALICPPLAHDSLTYHLILAGKWVQAGGTFSLAAPDAWSYYQYFPANGEVICAWFMLPFHGDIFVNLVNCLLWLLLLLSFYATARFLSVRARHAAIGALLLGFTPAVYTCVVTSYVEIGLLAELLCVLLFLFRSMRSRQNGDMLLTFMALGCALGTKLIALPVAAIATTCLLFATWTRGLPWPKCAGRLIAGLTVAAIVCVPWYLRAWVEQGSPLYPFPLRLFGHLIHAGSIAETEMLAAKASAFTEPKRIAWQLIKPYVLHGYTLGPLAVVSFLAAPLGVIAMWRRGHHAPTLVMLLSLCGVVAGYYSSDMIGVRLHWATISSRFLAFPLGILLLWTVHVLARPGRWSQCLRLILLTLCAINLILVIPDGFAHREMRIIKYGASFLIFACVILVVVWRITARHSPGAVRVLAAVLLIGVLTALPMVDWTRNKLRHSFFANAYEIHNFPRHGAAVWDYCDQPGKRHRIAFTAGWDGTGHNWFWYPLLGSRLQNDVIYVPITSDGEVIDYAHPDELAERADFDRWLKRLLREEVDIVVYLPPETFESRWIRRHDDIFVPVAGNDRTGAYAVHRQAARQHLRQ